MFNSIWCRRSFYGNTKTEKLHKDLFGITICLAKLYVWSRLWTNEYSFFFVSSTQHQALEDLRAFYFAGDMDLPQKHCCATLNIFTYLTVTCSFTPHAECIVAFPLQYGYANVPQCCVLRTLPVLLQISTCNDWMKVKVQLFAFLLIDHWTGILIHLGVS